MASYLILIGFLISASSSIAQIDISAFEGKWKINAKNSYEEWERIGPDSLSGKAYKIMDGDLKISEYLSITKLGDQYYYSAQVLDQNEGKKIYFKWIDSKDGCVAFENPEHDFPQRIRYCFSDPDNLKVNVTDMSEQGFQIEMKRVKK